jgi:UDP-glucuronate decarboxylase
LNSPEKGVIKLKILVTGGAGFLGSNLCRQLLTEGHEVICLDNLYTGRMKNIVDLLENERFSFANQDVQDEVNFEVEGIFNLACPASPIHYQRDPVTTLRTNVLGAIRVLDLANRTNARVLQASTSEVYGDPKVSPQVEAYWGNVNPVGIRSCYDEGKRAAETLFTDYHRQFGTDIRIARIFNTYGPAMSLNDGRVVSNLICQAIKNEPLTIYGDGSQSRSFCYVSDLIDGLVKLFFSNEIYTPMNIGNPEPKTMIELANEIVELSSSQSKIVYQALPKDDPLVREPEISFARQHLNWNPTVSLETGLIATIEYFRSEMEI